MKNETDKENSIYLIYFQRFCVSDNIPVQEEPTYAKSLPSYHFKGLNVNQPIALVKSENSRTILLLLTAPPSQKGEIV